LNKKLNKQFYYSEVKLWIVRVNKCLKRNYVATGPFSARTRKAPEALDPAVVVPSLGCKIYNGHSRYEP